jgi:hypothetical protein
MLDLFFNPANYDRSLVFSGYSGFYINKTDHYNITEILLKAGLITITKPGSNIVHNTGSYGA